MPNAIPPKNFALVDLGLVVVNVIKEQHSLRDVDD